MHLTKLVMELSINIYLYIPPPPNEHARTIHKLHWKSTHQAGTFNIWHHGLTP